MTENEKIDIAAKALERLVANPTVQALITQSVQLWLETNARRMTERVINDHLINGAIRSVAHKAAERIERRLIKLTAKEA